MGKHRKIVGIRDIAKEAKVSLSTVSFALNDPDRVAADTRRHVLRIAREFGYTRIRKSGRKGQIGILADDYYNLILGEFYNWVTWSMLEELKARNVNVLVESTGKDPDYFPRMIVKNLVDGVLLLGKSSLDLAYISKQKNIPLVMVGHPAPEVELHAVVPDGRSGACQAVNHLLKLGHKKIAIITGEPKFDPIISERIEGYRFVLGSAGIAERHEYVAEADICKPETAALAVHKLLGLKDSPTAIFCTSDSMAYRAYKAIKDKGLRIPQDISVVGFDDISAPAYAELPAPALTTVHVDCKEMGRVSVETLYDVMHSPGKAKYRYTLPVSLVVRGSTVPPR
jgi:LacI family repressor for deo operon, udp, cdd, tsx, nupC, and nupG